MELLLTRLAYHQKGCNGMLQVKGNSNIICSTIELPWKGNQKMVSCIPEGRYRIVKRYSPRLKWHLHLVDVPGRTLILIHPANNALKELKGCIAPVTTITGIGTGDWSTKAFDRLKAIVFPALDRGQLVFIIIQSQVNQQA